MTSTVLEVDDLVVQVGPRRLLDVAHLRAQAGSMVALLGPNGAGKTTFLRACLGLVPHARGRLRVLGQEVGSLRGAALAALRRSLGYVPQLLPGRSELPLTVREVVSIGRTARAGLGRPLSREDWQVVDDWMERLGLAPLATRAFSEISGGEQRKTVLARALAQEPALLLLDEPTAHLDLGWRERIVETIASVHAKTQLPVIMVCHELEVLPPACRQVVLLHAGAVLAVGAPEEVFTAARVATLYGTGLQVWHGAGRHAVVPKGGADA